MGRDKKNHNKLANYTVSNGDKGQKKAEKGVQVQMVRDGLTFEQSTERNHKDGDSVFQAENTAKVLRLDCAWCVCG